MPNHTTLRTLATARPASGSRSDSPPSLTLPLAACDTGVDPRNPSSLPCRISETAAPATTRPRWTPPENGPHQKGDPFLEFAEDGSLEGSDGCNAIVTTWKVKGDEIAIDSFMSTQKACAGVDTWLSKASTATIEGDVMKVKDSNGKVIGGLEKDDK